MQKRSQITIIVCMIFLLMACSSPSLFRAPPTFVPSNKFTQLYESLRDETAASLVEIVMLSALLNSSPLLQVGYISENNVVVGIYDNGGTVKGWNADTATVAFSHELGIVSPKALSLLPSGKIVIGATNHVFKHDIFNKNAEYVSGIAVWDVRQGNLIGCITHPCPGGNAREDGILGLATDADGTWLATFSETGLGLSSIDGNTPSLYYTINPLDASYQWQIGSVVFDERNRRYVVIFQECRIYVSDKEYSTNYHIIEKGTKGNGITVTDSIVDPTGRWLAVGRGDTTQLLNLDDGKVSSQFSVTNPVLAFDQTGEIFFVGSNNQLEIYSLDEVVKVSEYETPGITSLVVSEDNRLIIWGDVYGQVHVWGIPASRP